MPRRLPVLAVVLLALAAGGATAVGQDPAPPPPAEAAPATIPAGERLRDLAARQEAALAGDAAARRAFLDHVEAAQEAIPGDALLRAWRGSALSLQAIDAPLTRKLDWLRRAERELDGAVADAPADPAVRLTRALHSVSVPRIFGRGKVAREDFAALLALHDAGAIAGDPLLLAGVRRETARYLLAAKDRRALPLLEAAVAADPGDAEARRLLESAKDRFRAPNAPR